MNLEDFKNSLGNESGGVTLDELRELIDCIQAELDAKANKPKAQVPSVFGRGNIEPTCTLEEREILESLKSSLRITVEYGATNNKDCTYVGLFVDDKYLPAWQRLAKGRE